MISSVLFYVQYLLGIGHLQRSLRIAQALVQEGVAVTLVCGGVPVALPHDPSLRIVQLTPVRALDARFELVESMGRPARRCSRPLPLPGRTPSLSRGSPLRAAPFASSWSR